MFSSDVHVCVRTASAATNVKNANSFEVIKATDFRSDSTKRFFCTKAFLIQRFYARKQLLFSTRLSHRNSVCLSVRL